MKSDEHYFNDCSTPTKAYKVGDYYNENGKEGVVFDVWHNGLHGKIVGLDQIQDEWCTLEQYRKGIVVGADDMNDGKVNTDKVMEKSDYDMYPAFVWCRNKGEDWYLPAIAELRLLLLNDSVRDAVNNTLKHKGATMLYGIGEHGWYWSSSECNNYEEFCAWRILMYNGQPYHGNKDYYNCVRAVATF